MSYHTYDEEVSRLWDEIRLKKFQYNVHEEARISASLFHLRPDIDTRKHTELIQLILFNQRLASLDQRFLNLLIPNLHVENMERASEILECGGDTPVVCCYHYGSYRLLCPFLLARGMKISMLIDHHVERMQGRVFSEVLATFCRERGIDPTNYRIRNTANPNILRVLLRDLKENFCVIVYVDGNLGTSHGVNKSASAPNNTVLVPFMGASLYSRIGSAVIAYLAKRPIVPLMFRRQGRGENVVTLRDRFYPSPGEPRDVFIRRSCMALWGWISEVLQVDATQWESWRYADRSLDREKLAARYRHSYQKRDLSSSERPLVFNHQRYAISGTHQVPILFDRATYKMIPMSQKAYETLIDWESNGAGNAKDDAFFNQCVRLGILRAQDTQGP